MECFTPAVDSCLGLLNRILLPFSATGRTESLVYTKKAYISGEGATSLMAQPQEGEGGLGLPARGDQHRPKRTRRGNRSVVKTFKPTGQEAPPAQVVATPPAAPVEAAAVPAAPSPVASVAPVGVSVEAAAPAEHQNALLTERLIWITGIVVSWSVTIVALMRAFALL